MNLKDRRWLDEHKHYMYVSSRITKEDTQMIYEIYNRIYGTQKKPNGCGSCMRNTLKQIRTTYETES